MSRNIRPGAGAFPSRPTRSTQNDGYSYTSDPGGGAGHYGKPGRNDYSRHGGDDDGYYSQSQRSYGAGSNGRREDGRYPDRAGYNRSDNNTLSTGSTVSTTSSSGSSLLGRMKVRSADTSARTSIEDNNERMPARRGGWARNPPAVQENKQREEELDEPAPTRDPNSAGNTLWERITAATANLTINVSKAWENGVSLQDGEETPPGGETRLTRALKAYYIERARAPADLPPWLFEEHERRPRAARPSPRNQDRDDDRGGGRRSNMAPPSNRGRGYDDEYEQQPKRGALRDIYDSAAASNQPNPPAAGRTLAPSSYRDDGNGNVSRATSRLQALRDAKRLQPSSTGAPAGGRYDDPGWRGSANQGPPSPRDRYQATEDDGPYGGYEGGRRPEGGSSSTGRSSFDDGGRRLHLRAAMGLPSRPQRGGGY